MAEKADRDAAHGDLTEGLKRQAREVLRLTRGLDDERLSLRTIAGKWSLKELVCHLDRVQGVFDARVAAMVSEDRPRIVYYEPDGDPEFAAMVARQGGECVESFSASRERFLKRLSGLGRAEWHRPGQHADYPDYDVHFAVEYLLRHEAHHIYQMFQRRAPLGPIPH